MAQRSPGAASALAFSFSLASRIFFVLLAGILLAAAITFTLAQRDRREVIAHFHARETAQRFSDLLNLLALLPPTHRQQALDEFSHDEWRMAAPAECSGRPAPRLARSLSERLSTKVRIDAAFRLPENAAFDASRPPPAPRVAPPPPPPFVAVRGSFADGSTFCIVHQPRRRPPQPIEQWRFPLGLAVFVSLIALTSGLAVSLALRPLRRMTRAAEAFGRDIDQPALDTGGPIEVRQAAQAFNLMQERVRRAVAERTQILAAVTHDLKTPLTRMRLRLEACAEPALRDKLASDVAAMQHLVDEGLELARSMASSEASVRIDVGALLASIADDAADAGQPVSYSGPTGVRARAQPTGLRRAIENLVDNALKYGGKAEIELAQEKAALLICVADDGPGIPPEQHEEVMQPFVRLETSRSRESGGTGLGLTIAANLIAAQGGRLRLQNRAPHGLAAYIYLPQPPTTA